MKEVACEESPGEMTFRGSTPPPMAWWTCGAPTSSGGDKTSQSWLEMSLRKSQKLVGEVASRESPGEMTYKWFLLNRYSERFGAGGVLRRTFKALRGGRARAWKSMEVWHVQL